MKRRRLILLAVSVLALGLANLRPQCRVSVGGQTLPGFYRPAAVDRSKEAAREAAEEILRSDARMPELRRSWRLRLRPADGDRQALSGAILRAVPGVRLADEVSVNGLRLGNVADGERLCEELRASIRGQMPGAAVFGNISGQLSLRRVYTRAGHWRGYDEMIRLVTGAAPVIYVDQSGKLV